MQPGGECPLPGDLSLLYGREDAEEQAGRERGLEEEKERLSWLRRRRPLLRQNPWSLPLIQRFSIRKDMTNPIRKASMQGLPKGLRTATSLLTRSRSLNNRDCQNNNRDSQDN